MSKGSKTDVWYPFFVGDYRKDTARLSCEQHGAYRQLLDEYWITGPLPDDDAILARVVGLDLRVWRKHRPHIERFFTVEGGAWRHGRVDRELVAASERKAKAEAKAKAAADARWAKQQASPGDATSNAPSMPQAVLKDMHEECPPPSSLTSEVVPFPEPSEKTQPQQTAASDGRPRGSRLKPDWEPRADDFVYAVGEGFTEAEVRRMIENFRDYWLSKSGKDAVHVDWARTWRRWVRTEADRRARKPGARAPSKRVGFV